jgi:hypothetical protein
MSEYGCITNTRTFQEVSALYNTEMTGVFSGGLVYEYSQEGNGYGLVTISGDTVTPNSDFTYLQSAYVAQASSEWDVANDDLPAIPAAAEKYMSTGAGTGPGLSGAGSQNAGNTETESTGTASAGSGTVTETATSSSKKSDGVRIPAFDVQALSMAMAVLFSMAGGLVLL